MTIEVNQDMQEAIKELNQARAMFENAANKYRISEAAYRIKAAEEKIQAIRFEEDGKQ